MISGRALYWLLTVLVLALYGVIVLWSLPQIAAQAGGLVPFDMLPGGYDHATAVAFLTALTDKGRALYHEPQHWLDAIYPPALGLWLYLSCRGLWPDRVRWGLGVLAGLCAVVTLADWTENLLVYGLLVTAPDAVTAGQVAKASAATLTKSAATTAVFCALLGLLLNRAWRRFRR